MARGVRKALLAPVNLGVLALGGVGAAAVGSLALIALGGTAYAALVAWDLSSASFWRKVMGAGGAADRDETPRLRDVFDDETRVALGRVHDAHQAIVAAAANAGPTVAPALASVLHTVDEIDSRVGRLVKRSDELSRYLSGIDSGALHAEIAQLTERARAAPDADARRHYEQALKAREDQLKTLGDIAAARERLVANLAQIVATLEGTPAKLMKMRALDAQAADDVSGDVGREIENMNVELGAFEETLALLAESGAPT